MEVGDGRDRGDISIYISREGISNVQGMLHCKKE
jgi:hypothetical protein